MGLLIYFVKNLNVNVNGSPLRIQWETVCYGGSDAFDMRDAKVACRQLGYTSTVGYWWFGRGTGKVWLSSMQCTGSETSLQSCSSSGFGNGGWCSHGSDVGVVSFR